MHGKKDKIYLCLNSIQADVWFTQNGLGVQFPYCDNLQNIAKELSLCRKL